ncbi:uncharacterized protein LOC134652360 [Cydia amplana]|uniref:uncharacterized protein LOC134652360 n=1 Tax=Cydia amplana TaxID=1869771 RepID=UPI002FE5F488
MALSFLRTKLIARHAKKQFYQNKRNAGYVVLIPEIGEDGERTSLLGDNGLPEFSDVTIEKCIASISKQSLEYERGVAQIEHSTPTCKNAFDDVFKPLEKLDAQLELTWGVAKTLYLGNSSLMPTASYRNIHERAHKARSAKFNSVPIFQAAVNEKNKLKKLTDEEQRLLDKYILEGKLNGLDATGLNLEKLHSVVAELQKQKYMFREKVNTATGLFSSTITDSLTVQDFPETLLAAMAPDPSRGPWKVTLQPHVYEPFMQHCHARELRWNAWNAHVQRCSGYGNKDLETSTHLEKIRSLRTEQAKLLGFETFVDMSMETKMAGSAENVYNTLDSLLEHARPAQDAELDELQKFAQERGFDFKLEHWDIPYWQRKQKRTLYKFEEDKIREYFPLPRVVRGLFNLCRSLFDIQIEERSVQAWHRDVKHYDVFHGSGRLVAGFYLDPYARQHEKIRVFDDAGWHVALRNRCASTKASPLSALIFNFQPPAGERPSLLTFNEVGVLFQKFGHALRHLLTEANYSEVAGLSNVEWDAAEVCGHVLTHWLYDPHTIRALSGHHRTEEPLPDELVDNLHRVRRHMAGLNLCRELYFARLDLELHSSKVFWRDAVKELWPKHFALPFDKYDSHPLSFTKVVSEEWAAAYYCRTWSRMLAADVFGAWREEADARAVGARYRATFLAPGGGCAPGEVFRRFRGRDPAPHALLADLGLARKNTQE